MCQEGQEDRPLPFSFLVLLLLRRVVIAHGRRHLRPQRQLRWDPSPSVPSVRPQPEARTKEEAGAVGLHTGQEGMSGTGPGLRQALCVVGREAPAEFGVEEGVDPGQAREGEGAGGAEHRAGGGARAWFWLGGGSGGAYPSNDKDVSM